MTILRELLSIIPQDPIHHREGNVWYHVRKVRQSLDKAILVLQQSQASYPSLFNFDFNLNEEELSILKIAAWMHDIGKFITTTLTIGDEVRPFHIDMLSEDYPIGKWHAIGHEKYSNLKLMFHHLSHKNIWGRIWQHASFVAKKDCLYVILRHMELNRRGREGFGKRFAKKVVDANGKYKNYRRIKLLLVFIMMDRLGRDVDDPDANIFDTLSAMECGAKQAKDRINHPQSLPSPNDPQEFLLLLRHKKTDIVRVAFRGKFGRDPTYEEMAILN